MEKKFKTISEAYNTVLEGNFLRSMGRDLTDFRGGVGEWAKRNQIVQPDSDFASRELDRNRQAASDREAQSQQQNIGNEAVNTGLDFVSGELDKMDSQLTNLPIWSSIKRDLNAVLNKYRK
jgi:hypothetical protein